MWIILIILIIVMAALLYTNINPEFGGSVKKLHIRQYEKSPNWENGKFQNQEYTSMSFSSKSFGNLIKSQITNRKVRYPKEPLAIMPFNAKSFNPISRSPQFVWFGHSVVLLRINGKNLLIDPMFGPDTTPIAPFVSRRFSKDTMELIDRLPEIDAILLTHDHYDHIDYNSIQNLKSKTNTYLVALGVARHLHRWGIPKNQITEFDWYQDIDFHDIHITFTPSRHFSGRGLMDRAKCLWGGWIFRTEEHNIYWSGDGGYGSHFKAIGEQYGPFDWAFLECGQYNENWHQIHMYPEETVQAGLDARANILIPVHWGGFSLAFHPWKEPIHRFTEQAENLNTKICTPRLGQIVQMGSESETYNWWRHNE